MLMTIIVNNWIQKKNHINYFFFKFCYNIETYLFIQEQQTCCTQFWKKHLKKIFMIGLFIGVIVSFLNDYNLKATKSFGFIIYGFPVIS